MPFDYMSLPFISYKGVVSTRNRENYYKRVSADFTRKQINALRNFQNARFLVTGTSYILTAPDITGERKEKLFHLQGFALIEGDASYFTERENLNSFLLCYTLEGEGELVYWGKTYLLQKGQGFYIDCREYHAYRTHGTCWKTTSLHFDGPLCESLFQEYTQNKPVVFSYNDCPNFEMLQFNVLKASHSNSPYHDYKLSCLFDLMLTELLAAPGRTRIRASGSNTIEQIIRYYDQHYAEKITLSFLVKQFGISQAHLEREFKKATGFTPGAYLARIRLNVAKNLLEQTLLPINEVGQKSGFQNDTTFIQLFKKMQGVTPLKYRKQKCN